MATKNPDPRDRWKSEETTFVVVPPRKPHVAALNRRVERERERERKSR